jgi:hypothetical protein
VRLRISVAERFRMRSRTVAAFAIDDLEGKHRVAVIVFESDRPRRFTHQQVSAMLVHGEGTRLTKFLMLTQAFQPNPSDAKDLGY